MGLLTSIRETVSEKLDDFFEKAESFIEAVVEFFVKIFNPVSEPPKTFLDEIEETLNETEQKKVEETQALIRDSFGDDPAEYFCGRSKLERSKDIVAFAEKVAECYGLDGIHIDIMVSGKLAGYYKPESNTLYINSIYLTLDEVERSENFPDLVLETINTIIHELRHAVQHYAIVQQGFWNIDKNRVRAWEENFEHYIDPELDRPGYDKQAVEWDATGFAAVVMKGVQK